MESISEWLKGILPVGDGALPSITRLISQGISQGAGAPPGPTTFAPGPPRYAPAPSSLNGVSPASSQQPQGNRQGSDQQSPWSSHIDAHSHGSGSHPDIGMNWNTDNISAQRSRVGMWVDNADESDGGRKTRGPDQVLLPQSPGMQVPAKTWTTITDDSGLVQHLLALYFCWEYPTFASLSKEHFLKDFAIGRARFCSSMLVNALLALGCRFSTKPNTRANPNDPHTSGDHFFKETLRLFYQEENHHKLTTIQALGIMSIREASCGRDSESWFYAGQSIRLAIEMGLHRLQDEGRDDDESAVQAATFWGAFALDQ